MAVFSGPRYGGGKTPAEVKALRAEAEKHNQMFMANLKIAMAALPKYVLGTYAATLLGMKQVYPGRYEPKALVNLIVKEKVTFSHCVPTILQMILNALPKETDLSFWNVVIGGAHPECAVALVVVGLVAGALLIPRLARTGEHLAKDAVVRVGADITDIAQCAAMIARRSSMRVAMGTVQAQCLPASSTASVCPAGRSMSMSLSARRSPYSRQRPRTTIAPEGCSFINRSLASRGDPAVQRAT